MEKINDNVDVKYRHRYISVTKYAEDYKTIRPYIALMKEIGCWEEDSLPYCMRLQDDLYKKGIIPFKITSVDDWKMLSKCNSDVYDILYQAWLIVKRAAGYNEIFGLHCFQD